MRRISLIAIVALLVGLLPAAALADHGTGDHDRDRSRVQEYVHDRHQLADETPLSCEASREREREREQVREHDGCAGSECSNASWTPGGLAHGWLWEHGVGDACWTQVMRQLQHEWRHLIASPF